MKNRTNTLDSSPSPHLYVCMDTAPHTRAAGYQELPHSLGSFQRDMSCFWHRALRDQQQPMVLIRAHKLQPRLATGQEL